MSRSSLDASLVFLAVIGLIVAILQLRTVKAPHRVQRKDSDEGKEIALAIVASLLAAGLFAERLVDLAPVLVVYLSVAAAIGGLSPRLTMPGVLWRAAQVCTIVLGGLWSTLVVVEAGLPPWLEVPLGLWVALSLMLTAGETIASFAREAVVTNEAWRRPTTAPAELLTEPPDAATAMKVSLQLPCYAEPPEVVIETMDRLAMLEYPAFEVLVCDNNTADEALWRPLEAHCAVLNRRLGREIFRFFHVAPLPGAKAGALNFLLDVMAPDAQLIGVIDADYYSTSDFLGRLVPLFADPRMGYVQTPHDYRDYEDSEFLTACYWEYMPANKVDWPGVSEYGGAFTIGTMCLLRTEALRRAGGWAEWCLTEDSEVSVRLRAAGYHGLYLGETFGRGLIPGTFDDYRKQRFRWVAGPVQQLRRHWRLFRPTPWAPPMPGWTKLLEIVRCASPLLRLGAIAAALAGLLAMTLGTVLGLLPPADVPDVVWALVPIGAAGWVLRSVHRYRLAGCFRLPDMIRGEVARAALTYVTFEGGLAGLSARPLAWRRTPKFAIDGGGERPFAVARTEMIAAAVCGAATLLLLAGAPLWGWELALLGGLGLGTLAGSFLCAPLLVMMAVRDARKADRTAGGSESGSDVVPA